LGEIGSKAAREPGHRFLVPPLPCCHPALLPSFPPCCPLPGSRQLRVSTSETSAEKKAIYHHGAVPGSRNPPHPCCGRSTGDHSCFPWSPGDLSGRVPILSLKRGSKAARQKGSKAERQQGRKGAGGPKNGVPAPLLPCSLAAFPCCLAALLPCSLAPLPPSSPIAKHSRATCLVRRVGFRKPM